VFTAEEWREIEGFGSVSIDFQGRFERCLKRFCELESHEVASIFPLSEQIRPLTWIPKRMAPMSTERVGFVVRVRLLNHNRG
jgi:hypothetical protein